MVKHRHAIKSSDKRPNPYLLIDLTIETYKFDIEMGTLQSSVLMEI